MSNHLIINVYTVDLEWKAQIDSAESLIHRTSWHEIVTSEMTIGKTAQGLEELQVGRILVVNNQRDKALIIEDMVSTLDEQYIVFNLLPLKGMLNYRIAHPTDSAGGLTWEQRSQSQVMTWLCYDNLIKQTRDTDRYFWNSAKTKNMLKMASPTKVFGETIDYKVDWQTGELGEAIVSVAKMYATEPLGWNIYITEDFSAFEFDVYLGTHKHINQTDLPPVIFSEEFGNIKNATYEYSIKDWRNVAYMIWETETESVAESVITNLANGAAISFNRKEIAVETTKNTIAQVFHEGRSELNKRPHIESLTAEIINNDRTMSTYNEDWTLGDIVTIQSKELLKDKIISIDAQITETEEVYDSGEYSINATFGEGKLTLVQLIKNAIEQKR